MRIVAGLSIAVALAWGPASDATAEMLPADGCSPISGAVFGTSGAVPDSLLADATTAMPCLVDTLKDLARRVRTTEIGEPERDALNRATAALGKLIDSKGVPMIQQVREVDTPDVVSLLSFGARSNDRTTRLNSTLVLSNIVDNSTVCVVMDHLADPDLTRSVEGRNGRANLLAVVSVVAPWAMKSNYQNMQKLIGYVAADIKDKDDVADTTRILANFEERLKFQDKVDPPNRNVDSLASRSCWAWTPLYGSNTAFRIEYPPATATPP